MYIAIAVPLEDGLLDRLMCSRFTSMARCTTLIEVISVKSWTVMCLDHRSRLRSGKTGFSSFDHVHSANLLSALGKPAHYDAMARLLEGMRTYRNTSPPLKTTPTRETQVRPAMERAGLPFS